MAHLDFLILKMLTNEEMSGYSIAKELEKETNWKPSYGSLYPSLNLLKKKKLVDFRINGRQKIYSITNDGRKKLKEFEHNKEEFAHNIEKNVMVMNKCFGDNKKFAKMLFKSIITGKMLFGSVTPKALEFRNMLIYLASENKIEKNSEKIMKILENAIKGLKQI